MANTEIRVTTTQRYRDNITAKQAMNKHPEDKGPKKPTQYPQRTAPLQSWKT